MKERLMKYMVMIFALTLGSLGFSSPAYSADYISVGGMVTDYNVGSPANTFFSDHSSGGYEVAFGRQLPISWLSLEFALSDNGESSKNVGPFNFLLESKSVAVLLHGQWPVASISGHDINLHARYGYSFTRFRGTETTLGLSNVSSDIGLTYGLGLSYWFSPHWGLELDYMRRQHEANVIPLTVSSFNMDQGILKAVYKF